MMSYEPRPLPTQSVVLNSQLLQLTEALARNTHEVWASQRSKEGWKHGPRRDDIKKEHPNLVPYEQLGESEKEYDRKVALETLKVIVSLGWSISKTPVAVSQLREEVPTNLTATDTSHPEGPVSCFMDPQSEELHDFLETEGLVESKAAITKRLELWNTDQVMIQAYQPKEIETNCTYLSSESEQKILPSVAYRALRLYGVADTLAIHYRNLLRRMSLWVIGLAFIALLSLELFHFVSHFESPTLHALSALPIVAFSVLWVIVIGLHRKSGRMEWQNRYQDYRAVAESLRVQFYWAWAGLRHSVEASYLERHRGELNWIRYALRHWFPTTETIVSDSSSRALNAWTKSQLDYYAGTDQHSGAIKKNHDANLGCQHKALICIYLAAILGALAAVVTVVGLFLPGESREKAGMLGNILTLLCGLFLVITAVFYTIRERFAFAEHEKNYSAMRNLYLKAKQEEEKGQSVSAILHELGVQALMENAEWLMLHRERHATDPRI